MKAKSDEEIRQWATEWSGYAEEPDLALAEWTRRHLLTYLREDHTDASNLIRLSDLAIMWNEVFYLYESDHFLNWIRDVREAVKAHEEGNES